MADQSISCPSCGKKIPLTRALRAEIEASVKQQFDATLQEHERELRAKYDDRLDQELRRLRKEASQDAQSQVDCYDPETDTWTTVAPLPDVRSHTVASTFVMNGTIIVLGGEIGFIIQRSTIYAYDPTSNTWSLLGLLPEPRSTSVAGEIGANQIITTSGNGPNAESETWIGTVS